MGDILDIEEVECIGRWRELVREVIYSCSGGIGRWRELVREKVEVGERYWEV